MALPTATNFKYGTGKWWGAHVQTYACLRSSIKGTELHQHHLVPKSLFTHGPGRTWNLIDYIPSVTLEEREHLSAVHGSLNACLKERGLWQVPLTESRLTEAIRTCGEFYAHRGLSHFAAAIEEFRRRVYSPAS
jgi:hypothetical protein